MNLRTGQGFDAHAFGPGDHVIIGGVRVPYTRGILAHSDGDVLLHALCDALLGAVALGDLGSFFPAEDDQWRDADSQDLLRQVVKHLKREGCRVVNVDSTVICQAPKLAPHREAMRTNIAASLQIPVNQVSVKSTTTDGLGCVGRGEGIAAQAIVLVEQATG